jgi:hypothetical protein
MKIGSDSSIYGLFSPKPRTAPSIADEGILFTRSSAPQAPTIQSDQEAISDFHARMAKQSVDWADTNKDGRVTKAEFMDGQARLAQMNDRPNDTEANERRWATLYPHDSGSVGESELREGYEKILPVSIGHLDAGYAQRLSLKRS